MRGIIRLGLLICPSLGYFACSGGEAQTFVIKELIIPQEEDDLSSSDDLDSDGTLDNSLPNWVSTASILGLDIQEQLTEQVNSGEYLFGIDIDHRSRFHVDFSMFRATSPELPRFDGSDQIFSTGEEFSFPEASFDRYQSFPLKAQGATFDWLLFPFGVGDLITVPLQDARVGAFFFDDDSKLKGKITGHVNVLDAARLMERVPAIFDAVLASESVEFGGGKAVPCESNSTGLAFACTEVSPESFCSDRIVDHHITGVCVGQDTASRRLLQFMDINLDGHYSVDFDEASGLFLENELALMLDLQSGFSPRGIVGSMFTLDLDRDDINESMPIGVHFTAIIANQK
jgi:hypothetical protein